MSGTPIASDDADGDLPVALTVPGPDGAIIVDRDDAGGAAAGIDQVAADDGAGGTVAVQASEAAGPQAHRDEAERAGAVGDDAALVDHRDVAGGHAEVIRQRRRAVARRATGRGAGDDGGAGGADRRDADRQLALGADRAVVLHRDGAAVAEAARNDRTD
jgi:hypothetical protein